MRTSTKLFFLTALGAVLAGLCAGCHTATVKLPGGAEATVKSFGRKSSIDELSVGPTGTLRLKGYNNDEVTGLGIAVGALKELARDGAKSTVVP